MGLLLGASNADQAERQEPSRGAGGDSANGVVQLTGGLFHEVGLAVRAVLLLIPTLDRWVYSDPKFRAEVRILPRYDEPTILPLRLTKYYNVPRVEVNLRLQNLSAYRLQLDRLELTIDAITVTLTGGERTYPRRPEPYNLDPFTRHLTTEEYARLSSLTGQTVRVGGAILVHSGRRHLRVPVSFAAKVTTTAS